jgi:hypothetical protein
LTKLKRSCFIIWAFLFWEGRHEEEAGARPRRCNKVLPERRIDNGDCPEAWLWPAWVYKWIERYQAAAKQTNGKQIKPDGPRQFAEIAGRKWLKRQVGAASSL